MKAVNVSLGFESGPIEQLLTGRGGGAGIQDTLNLVDGILDRLASLVEVVDRMPGGGVSS
jgi:hypothetical protein